jgi:adenylate cyclase class 2
MYEVEVKVAADHERVREALSTAGGEHVTTLAQADTYFDAPHRDFVETDEALRVRREATATADFERRESRAATIDSVLDGQFTARGESRVTYKGPLLEAESKTREEFETGVEDGETMREILARLGFDSAATVRKLRKQYRLEGCTVLLDAVEGVGEYVEVETDVEDEAAVEAARENLYGLLRDLGLDPTEQIRTSYLGLLLGDA